MFDIGFFELVLISVVALLVLGPEKLPGAIRTITLWIGRLRRSFNTIKQDIEREVGADEIRRQLRNEEIMERFRKTQSTVKSTISDVQKKTDEFKKNIDLEAQVAAFTSNDNSKSADTGNNDAAANTSAADAETRAFADTPADNGAAATESAPKSSAPQGDG
jgi:sec-independent protein translocase protein TatB